MAPHDGRDRAIADAFSSLRAARTATAGQFLETVRVGRARAEARRSRGRRRLALTLATALPVTAALTLYVRERGSEREALQLAEEAAAIAQWRSPTETLLAHPYVELMREIPSLHASVVDPEPDTPAGGSR